jgi:hypothetical protein
VENRSSKIYPAKAGVALLFNIKLEDILMTAFFARDWVSAPLLTESLALSGSQVQ